MAQQLEGLQGIAERHTVGTLGQYPLVSKSGLGFMASSKGFQWHLAVFLELVTVRPARSTR